jgi:aspartyl protease family protein
MQSGVGRAAPVVALLLLVFWTWSARAERVSVPDTLEQLAEEGDFEVTGLDKATDAFGRDDGGDVYSRLRGLLDGFNHVIVQTPAGGISKVIIIGVKTAWTPPPPAAKTEEPAAGEAGPDSEIVVSTERSGASHTVSVGLEGEGGKRADQNLMVDTGADFVTLPASLLGTLGIQPQGLKTQDVQTANGKTKAQLGTLSAVWFGNNKVADVQVAFIDDAQLGGKGLLGMSVLGRYRMTIDDQANHLILAPKNAPAAASSEKPEEAPPDEPAEDAN